MSDNSLNTGRKRWLSSISSDQSKDTGMAMTLIALLLGFFTDNELFFMAASVLLVVAMAIPHLYRPMAIVWFGLSNLLGSIVSRVLLTVVFFAVITPMGLAKRLFGSEPLQLRKWKHGDASVFTERGQVYTPVDLENPY